ncbi:MATE family efflux transporter [Fundidesulfovibrio terrae]|uniref:MATE family efflux transporter n=1 Tax=Fundidesulfovibrio terrae TaxID=2922866 RepID=UPI001FAEB42C|nr:MATE family efflux transporter [Fundidesulfovibrio terrae]
MTTAASPYRSIWQLTWPQILMMVFQFLIGVADVYVCGRIGREAQAAMGLVSQALFFFLTVAIAVANGSVAALSQSLGAGRKLRAARFGGLCLLSGVLLSGVIVALGLPLKGLFLSLLNVPAEVRGPAASILGLWLWLLPINYLFLITNAVLRSHKMVMAPLYAMGLSCALNAWLDFGLGLGWWGMPAMGYMGVAWSTFWSMTGGLLINLALLARAGLLNRGMIPAWRWARVAWKYVFRVAWPSGLMQVVWHTGYLVLLAITGGLPSGGVEALAGFAGGARIESGVFLPAFAFNLSASVLVGHALGRGDAAEAKRMGYRVWGLGMTAMTLLAACLWPFLPQLSWAFAPDAGVAAQAVSYLRYNLMAVPFTCTSMILAGALTGAGATVYNLIVFGVSIWLVRLPVAWWLGWKAWGTADGVWFSMLVSQAFQATALLMAYQFKDWSRFSMIKSRNNRE